MRSTALKAVAVALALLALSGKASALSYVALGDSLAVGAGDGGGGGYVARYRAAAETDLQAPVTLQNLGVGGTTSQDLLTALTTDSAVRAAVAGADIVTFDIGGNDFLIAFFAFQGGMCGGTDGQDCLRQAIADFETNWPAILAELRALNPGAMMRTMTYYSSFVVDPGDGSSAVAKTYIEPINATIRTATPSLGIAVAEGAVAFNGPRGTEDPIAKGYMDADHIHPSPLGYDVLGEAFHQLGYAPIPGTLVRIPSSIAVRDAVPPLVDPAKRKLSLQSSTKKGQGPANRIVLPYAGGPQDPRTAGGQLEIYNAVGSTTDHAFVALPSTGWSLAGTNGFAFRGASPSTRVQLKPDKLKVKVSGSGLDYSLDEASQGAIAARLTFGVAGGGWCAADAAKVSGTPPSTAAHDRPGKFTGAKNATAPASCPPDGPSTPTPTPPTTPTPTSTPTPALPTCSSGSCGGCGSCGDGFCAIEASPPGCTHNGTGNVCVSNSMCTGSSCSSDAECGAGKVCVQTGITVCCGVCP